MRLIAGLLYLCILGCGSKADVKGLQLRLVWSENPSTESTLVWTSPTTDLTWQVYLSPDSNFSTKILPNQTFQPIQYNNEAIFSENQNPFMERAKFTGLKADTKYFIKLESSATTADQYWFRTAPEHDDYSLLFGGDSRSDRKTRRNINHTIGQIFAKYPDIIALVHGGDYIDNGKDWRRWSLWFNDYQLTTGSDGRLLPIIPTRGNHENDKTLYNQVFGLENDHPGYFKSRIGSLDLIVLNSEESILGAQYQWLEEQLQEAQDQGQWAFPNYHRPAYPAVKRPAATRMWVPLFESYQIRLVFESDGHAFKKTVPIFQDQRDVQRGVIYLGEGGLGVKQRTPKSSRWYFKEDGLTFKKNHFILAKLQGNNFHIEALDESGERFHQFQLKSRQGQTVTKGTPQSKDLEL